MSRKKKRGVPTLYSESKVKVGVSLTPTGAKRLGDIAKQLGLSRSEFVERIARGQFDVSESGSETTIKLATKAEAKTVNSVASLEPNSTDLQVQSEASQPSQNQNSDLVELQKRYQTLQDQSQEQVNTIQNLEEQLTQLSQLEAQLAQTVPSEEYQQLQHQLQQQLQTVEQLQQQLAKAVPSEEHQQLQHQLQQQLQTVEQLQQQLAQAVPSEEYQQLRHQLQQQLQTVEQLEQQLAQAVPSEEHQQLQHQLQQQLQTIQQLEQQLQQQLEHQEATVSELRHQLEQQLTSQPEQETQLAHSLASTSVELHSKVSLEPSPSSIDIHHQSNQIASHHAQINLALTHGSESDRALQQKVEEQEKTINKLQKEIMELRGLATIAESHLGRWRYKNFSH